MKLGGIPVRITVFWRKYHINLAEIPLDSSGILLDITVKNYKGMLPENLVETTKFYCYITLELPVVFQ